MLQPKDLMLGDWVFLSDNNCFCRMTAIYGYYGKMWIEADDEVYHIDEILPISITHDILAKNGFNYDGGEIYDIRWDDNDGHHCMNFRKMYNKDGVFDALGIRMGGEVEIIKYVHELQHLLKLCGIDEEIVL